MLTSLLRTHPVLGLVLGLAGSALLVVVGVAGALAAGEDAGSVVVMAFVAALGVLTATSLLAEAAWRSRRPFARLTTSPAGRPATLLPFSAVSVWARAALLVLVVAAGAAGLVAALDAGSTGWAVFSGLVGLVALVPLLPVLAGRVRAGGVYVTAQGVELRRLATGWQVRWDDLEGVVPRAALVPLVVRPEASVERVTGAAYGWRGEPRTEDDRVLGIDPRYLSVDGSRLGAFLLLYLAHPQMRADLGTQESVDWAREPTP